INLFYPYFQKIRTEVTVGDSIELECHMTGSGPIKVTWSKDHKDIRSGGNYKISCVENTPHLTILKADKGDTGRYFCHASNDMGKDSCSSNITVKAPFRGVSLCGRKTTSLSSHHFLILFSERKNPPVFTKKPSEQIEDMEGKLVKIEGRVSGSNVAVLCIKSSQMSDSGRYSCQASNEAGRASCDVTVGITGGFDSQSLRLILAFLFSGLCKLNL
uniref:Ig-like domain-containing protein n=1 Tax=Seriola dumerili TaxID=41447 RepID=A0A3B4TDA9_SERDU